MNRNMNHEISGGVDMCIHILPMLQAFAAANTVVTTSADETGSGSNIKPELRTYYHRVFLDNAKANLVHEQFGRKIGIPRRHGQTINMRKTEHLPEVSTPLTEGVTPDGGILRITEVTCGIEQFGYWIGLSDMVDLTAPDEVLSEAVEELGYQGSSMRDKYVRNKMAATTNKLFAPTSSGTAVTKEDSIDSTCKLTVKLIRTAMTKMKANNIKPFSDGMYVCIVHPYVIEDLKNDVEFKEWNQYTEAGVKKMYMGEVGFIEKVRFVESTNALITKNTNSHSVFHCFVLGEGGYGVTGIEGEGLETVIKPYGSGDDPLNQRMTAGWKTVIGAKVLSDEACMDMVVGSSYDTAAAN